MIWLVIGLTTLLLLLPFTVEGEARETQPTISQEIYWYEYEPPPIYKAYEIQSFSDKEIIEYVIKLWGEDADTMIKIIACESGFDPKAINWNDAKITGMPSQGVAQINAPYNEKLFDWKYNLDVAFEMYQRRGFQPWSCYKLI